MGSESSAKGHHHANKPTRTSRNAPLLAASILVVFVMLLSLTNPGLFAPSLPKARTPSSTGNINVKATPIVDDEDVVEPTANPTSTEKEGDVLATKNPRCNAGNKKEWRPAKCQDDKSWLVPWINARGTADWTLVDVGANKGYVIAEWLEVLLGAERTEKTPHNLGVGLYSSDISSDMFKSACGGCCECVEPPASIASDKRAKSVKVYGFEPSPANYKWLASFFTNTDVVNITHAAVAHKESRSYFPDNPLGVEIGKVRETYAKGYVKVDVVTLDKYLSHLDYIDVLSTDAEGFDQDVAKGAESFLKNGRVGVYQFEMYRAEDYKGIFDRLNTWGYDCYFATESRAPRIKVTSVSIRGGVKRKKDIRYKVPMLVRITDCWEEEYQSYTGWVNGLCANRKVEHLEKIFRRLEVSLHQGGNGNCPSRVQQRGVVLGFVEKYVKSKVQQANNSSGQQVDASDESQAPDTTDEATTNVSNDNNKAGDDDAAVKPDQ